MKRQWLSLLGLAVVLSGACESMALPRVSLNLENENSDVQESPLYQENDEFTDATLEDVIYKGTPVKTTDLIARSTVQIEITTTQYSALKMAICSGTLISKDLVVTAGHCIPSAGTLMNIRYYSEQTKSFQRINVLHMKLHEKYSLSKTANGSDNAVNDIALLRLAQPVPNAIPALLPQAGRALPQGQSVIVAGYGLNGHTRSEEELLKDPDILALIQKAKENPHMSEQDRTNLMMQMMTLAQVRPLLQTVSKASFESGLPTMILNGGDPVCGGDSGGPTYLRDSGRLVVFGVHSTSTSSEDCQPHKVKQADYGFDTYVPKYVDWIRETAKGI